MKPLKFPVMKPDPDQSWEVICHDPSLRQELANIEHQCFNDQLINELLLFFSKIDGRLRVAEGFGSMEPDWQ